MAALEIILLCLALIFLVLCLVRWDRAINERRDESIRRDLDSKKEPTQ